MSLRAPIYEKFIDQLTVYNVHTCILGDTLITLSMAFSDK